MTGQHPFAQYVRTIARGPNLSRPLTEEEMAAATPMILDGQVDPLQLGAFLCVLRVRTEDPGETMNMIGSDDPAVVRIVGQLHGKIIERMRETNDPVLAEARGTD